MKKALLAVVLFLGSISTAFGDNPMITHIFTADPAALVYNGRVYLYTGHDEQSEGGEGFVMNDWHVFSSADMVNWTDHGEVLKLSTFSWATANAWAGQCVERNGKFYWYVPMSHRTIEGFAIGVAVADSPTGPFRDARGSALITNDMTRDVDISWDDIDPTVLIDDDGQAYLYWGNTRCNVIKLKDNMIEVEGSYMDVPGLSGFTEAPYIHKDNGIYYMSYAAGYPETIDYATSNGPLGPWTYRGRINDTVPNSPTNHQSIIKFNNQWYFIYHNAGLPAGGEFRRSVCAEYLYYNSDGTIRKVTQTQAGVSPSVPPGECRQWNTTNDQHVAAGRAYTQNQNDGCNTTTTYYAVGSSQDMGTSGAATTTLHSVDGGQTYQVGDCPASDPGDSGENITLNGTYSLLAAHSGKALDVWDWGTTDGTNIAQYNYWGGEAQQFVIAPVDGIWHRITPAIASDQAVDVSGCVTDAGANIQTWSYWGGECQQWRFEKAGDNNYRIIARHSSLCLDVLDASQEDGANVIQYTCIDDAAHQKFQVLSPGSSSSTSSTSSTSSSSSGGCD